MHPEASEEKRALREKWEQEVIDNYLEKAKAKFKSKNYSKEASEETDERDFDFEEDEPKILN